jgi:hypothetical protein
MYFTVMRIVLPFFYAVPAVWGIVTAVGLLQLKNWARISTFVISILLIVFGVFGILTSAVFFLKPPPIDGVDPKNVYRRWNSLGDILSGSARPRNLVDGLL